MADSCLGAAGIPVINSVAKLAMCLLWSCSKPAVLREDNGVRSSSSTLVAVACLNSTSSSNLVMTRNYPQHLLWDGARQLPNTDGCKL